MYVFSPKINIFFFNDYVQFIYVWCVYTGLCDAPSAAERWVVISSVSASRSRFQMQPPASSLTGVKREQGQSVSSAGT